MGVIMVSNRDAENVLWLLKHSMNNLSPEAIETINNSVDRMLKDLFDTIEWLDKDPNRRINLINMNR